MLDARLIAATLTLSLAAAPAAGRAQQSPPQPTRPYPVGNPLGLPIIPAADGQFSPISSNVKVYGSVYSAESCSYDPDRNVIVVPNRGVPPSVRVNDAWITFLNHDGSVHTSRWLGVQNAGPQRDTLSPPLVLNEPFGSDIVGGVLYLADRDGGADPAAPILSVVRRFDMRSGAPLAAIAVPGASWLNDIAVNRDGTVYGTVTGEGQLWRVLPSGQASVVVQGAPLSRPNGVAIDREGNIVVVNVGSDSVLTFSPAGSLVRTERAVQSGNDGIVIMEDGTKYVSSVVNGGISRIRRGQPAELIAENIPNAASMCYDSGERQLVIPMNANNALAFLKLPRDVGTTSPRAAADPVTARLQTLADSVLVARPRMPGLVIHVESTRDGRRWTVAAGMSDTARKVPMRADQPFRIASVSKTYVAAAVLRLVERGVISLNDPIEKHIPAHLVAMLQRDSIRTDVITMEQLLAHRAGLDEHTSLPSYLATLYSQPRKRWTREEQVRLLVDSLQPVGAPGAQFKYSDTGYVLLGAVVERYTGKSLGPGVRELVGFDRLGLKQTWWETLEPEPAGVAPRAHQYISGKDTYDIDPSFDLYGGGGIAAPMADVAAFMSALQAGRVFEKQATLDTMLAVRSPNFMAGYGLGIFRVNSQGRTGIGHSGYWGTVALHYPAEGITVAVGVTEQTQGGAIYPLAGAALRAVLPLIGRE